MVAAHSGAVAGDTAGWTAFCAATGAVRATDLAEFTDTLELFAAGRRPRHAGGIAAVSDSGAERALCADVADDLGVDFAALSQETLGTLGQLLDDGLEAANPLDVWGTGADTRALFGACLRAVSSDPAVSVTALAVDLVSEYDGDTAYPDAVLDVAADSTAPLAVLASVPSAVDPVTAQRLRDNGVPVLEGMRSGLAAMGHLARWPLSVDTVPVRVDEQRRRRWRERLSAGPVPPFELLADYGIPVIASHPAGSVEEALTAARRIGYPVALKTQGALHKTEVGGVVLGLADDDALRAAYLAMSEALGPQVSVDAMARPGAEVSVGVVHDDAFGPLLVVAAGGVAMELLNDRAVACPPIGHAGARRLLDALRMAPLLAGYRGARSADIDALAGVITGFSQLAVELGDVLAAVEANPVIASPDGAVAVDALVVRS
jgi:acyl-CoA synthetase (NDP forming)